MAQMLDENCTGLGYREDLFQGHEPGSRLPANLWRPGLRPEAYRQPVATCTLRLHGYFCVPATPASMPVVYRWTSYATAAQAHADPLAIKGQPDLTLSGSFEVRRGSFHLNRDARWLADNLPSDWS